MWSTASPHKTQGMSEPPGCLEGKKVAGTAETERNEGGLLLLCRK